MDNHGDNSQEHREDRNMASTCCLYLRWGKRKIGMDTGRLFMSQCDREFGCTLYSEILSDLNLKVID